MFWFFFSNSSRFLRLITHILFLFFAKMRASLDTERSIVLGIFVSHTDINILSRYCSTIYTTIQIYWQVYSQKTRAPVLRHEREREQRKTKGNFFRTFLRVCSNSHRNSSARAHGRFLSTTTRTTTRVDTLLHININVDFMFASTKSLVSRRKPVLETSRLPLLFSVFFFFFFCVFLLLLFLIYIFLFSWACKCFSRNRR